MGMVWVEADFAVQCPQGWFDSIVHKSKCGDGCGVSGLGKREQERLWTHWGDGSGVGAERAEKNFILHVIANIVGFVSCVLIEKSW